MARKITWTDELIRSAFERFKKENGRYPTVNDIDRTDYFPSSKQLQRRFGGVRQLREKLGFDVTDYGVGEFRSVLATEFNKLSRQSEVELERLLFKKFGEMFVHREKPLMQEWQIRLDFFVYTKTKNFGVDVFVPSTLKQVIDNVNHKQRKYTNPPFLTYFVDANKEHKQEELDKKVLSKLNQLHPNIRVITLDDFLIEVSKFEPYKAV